MSYVYKRPDGKLHKVSIKKWNQTFARRGRWPFVVAEVYLQEDSATIHYCVSIWGKLLFWALSPLYYVIVPFIVGFSEAHRGFKSTVFDKHRGAFSSDFIRRESSNDGWERLMRLIGEED